MFAVPSKVGKTDGKPCCTQIQQKPPKRPSQIALMLEIPSKDGNSLLGVRIEPELAVPQIGSHPIRLKPSFGGSIELHDLANVGSSSHTDATSKHHDSSCSQRQPIYQQSPIIQSPSYRQTSVLKNITNTPDQFKSPRTPSKLITSRYISSPTSNVPPYRLPKNGITSCGSSMTSNLGHLSDTQRISRPRGRPKKYPQQDTYLVEPSSENDTISSEGQHSSSSSIQLPIKSNKDLITKRRGRPPKYAFSSNDLIPCASSATQKSNIQSVDSQSAKMAGISTEYRDIGDAIYVCNACKACLWKSEAMRGNKSFTKKIYSLCCLNGKVELPTLNKPPQLLMELFSGTSDRSKKFVENVKRYNMMFSFTSIVGKVDHKINSGKGPYVYRMCGQNYHLGGSLIPQPGKEPRFCQLYIYDTKHEVDNRINAYSNSHNASSNTSQYGLDSDTVFRLKGLLDQTNPLVKKFRMARDRYDMNEKETIKIKLIGSRAKDGRTYNLPTADEVAALVIGDIDGTTDKRDIILDSRSKGLKRISELHPSYLALQYPILFPYAEDGYRPEIFHKGVEIEDATGHSKLTIREFFAFRLQKRVNETSLILLSRKLLQQFIVDAYTMVENTRLFYIRNNQKAFRRVQLSSLYEAQNSGDNDVSIMGTRVTLPSSFTGGARYMQQNYLDAMAIWPEILRFLEPYNLKPEDRPDITTCVFKIKLDALMKQIKKEKLFGKLQGHLYVIEFQKRGLPHAHICIFIDKEDKIPNPEDIDKFICAEIPNKEDDPELYTLVQDFMMHGPCGPKHLSCPCMVNKECSKHFPKDFTDETHFDKEGYPLYRRRDDGNFIMKKDSKLDNRSPAVYRLSFHLPDHQPIVFDEDEPMESVLEKPSVGASQFIEWMNRNRHDNEARQYTYVEFPRYYVWNGNTRKWTKRTSQKTVGRIHFVHPKSGESYYLRILLNKVSGPTCFEDIRTVDGKVHDSFKEACYALGLLNDDKEYIASIKETHTWASEHYCRGLFVSLITSDSIACPDRVWKETCDLLSDDLKHEVPERLRTNDVDKLTNVLHNLALAKIEIELNRSGATLKNIPNMPFPDYEFINTSCNMLIQDELNYNIADLEEEHRTLCATMTTEQKVVYDTIIATVDQQAAGLYFVYGYGGTGKTFVWKTLAAAIRSRGDIVINVASSGIAALLLTGGRTAHSRFSIPINVLEDSFCSIQPDSELAKLLNQAKLIIWDEAPMMHKHCFEAFDRTMRDIIRPQAKHKPFGGKVVVFGGDFRQILPIIQRGTRAEIVNASLHSSYLWRDITVLELTKNMRLRSGTNEMYDSELADFAYWILKIGEGKLNLPNDGEADIDFQDDILLKTNENPIETIIDSTYPRLRENMSNPKFFQDRAILAPTNEQVDSINDHVLSNIDGDEKVYYSSDSLCLDKDDDLFAQQLYSPEILNELKVPGVPNHKLTLKVGVPIMLLRNIDQSKGLCNGTRLQVERLGEHTIEARIITGHSFGNITYIPRMIVAPTDNKIAVRFQRRQFPISVCFSMTINKSQGQSLANVGLYLRKPVFTHGQLYVAVSRVTSKKGLKVVLLDDKGKDTCKTKNVVYKEGCSHQLPICFSTFLLLPNYVGVKEIFKELCDQDIKNKKRIAVQKCRQQKKECLDNLQNTIQHLNQQLQEQHTAAQKSTDNQIDPLNKQILDHYIELAKQKSNAAKLNVFSILFGSWMSHVEQFLAWLGGLRPSNIVKLITNHVELSERQIGKMNSLKDATLEEEMKISTYVHNLQDTLADSFNGKSFVDKGDFSAMNNYSNQMSENLGRMSVVSTYCDQADELRITTLENLQTILTTRQHALAWITLHNYQKRLLSFNHQWQAIPI
ncbi:uncharacterized protein [Rutidosis leptorrhynchoides]|uniref:uncharacterized protein n=1 Tax=Rutidosis leptorrhynchoides TaxID=125765 RepID=UPI003A9A2F2E